MPKTPRLWLFPLITSLPRKLYFHFLINWINLMTYKDPILQFQFKNPSYSLQTSNELTHKVSSNLELMRKYIKKQEGGKYETTLFWNFQSVTYPISYILPSIWPTKLNYICCCDIRIKRSGRSGVGAKFTLIPYRAFRLVVWTSFVFESSKFDWLK